LLEAHEKSGRNGLFRILKHSIFNLDKLSRHFWRITKITAEHVCLRVLPLFKNVQLLYTEGIGSFIWPQHMCRCFAALRDCTVNIASAEMWVG